MTLTRRREAYYACRHNTSGNSTPIKSLNFAPGQDFLYKDA